MGKLLVQVKVPAIAAQFDVWVPDFLSVRELMPLIVETVEQMTSNAYTSSGSEVLCLADAQKILPGGGTLRDFSVRNGDILMLI